MLLTVKLKRRLRPLGRSVLGSATLKLSDVMSDPNQWGEQQWLHLTGPGQQEPCAKLKVQLFLSTERVSGPLSVLCATWNVGNAMPPPSCELADWLRGAEGGQHHLIAVAAQECNYTKDARRASTVYKHAKKGSNMPDSDSSYTPKGSKRHGTAGGSNIKHEAVPVAAAAQIEADTAQWPAAAAQLQASGANRSLPNGALSSVQSALDHACSSQATPEVTRLVPAQQLDSGSSNSRTSNSALADSALGPAVIQATAGLDPGSSCSQEPDSQAANILSQAPVLRVDAGSIKAALKQSQHDYAADAAVVAACEAAAGAALASKFASNNPVAGDAAAGKATANGITHLSSVATGNAAGNGIRTANSAASSIAPASSIGAGNAAPLTPCSSAAVDPASARVDFIVHGHDGLRNDWGRRSRAQLKNYLLEQVDSAYMWERHIAAALGPKYWLLASKHMFQTRLLLFVRMDVLPSISNIMTNFEATGFGRIGPNKGGVGVSFTIDDTRFAIVCAHLAAHQGKTAQRNEDVAQICDYLHLSLPGGVKGADLVTGFHHVIWMGDLNYRLNYGEQATTYADSPTAEDFQSLCNIVHAGKYQQLLALDQLKAEQAAGRVFVEFKEGHFNFAPTFKMHTGEAGLSYHAKRSPAWCDRVLFNSALPHKQASCRDYYCTQDIVTSDHKPVGAILSLPLATDTAAAATAHRRAQFKLLVVSARLLDEATWQKLAESVARREDKHRGLKLQLVLSAPALGGLRQEHVCKMNAQAVAAGMSAALSQPAASRSSSSTPFSSAALQCSLLAREETVPLHRGTVQDYNDEWLLLCLVLVDGFKTKTLARGILPMQPAVADFTSFKPVQVQVQLQHHTAAVGTCLLELQLIGPMTARQAMYEAIRRMRTLASMRSRSNVVSQIQAGNEAWVSGNQLQASELPSGSVGWLTSKLRAAGLARQSAGMNQTEGQHVQDL
eukprot:GHRR01019372.1.p1 GENE.GHRR01019372.1~~GHRR01019372.1.p1  ORF type:complete len:956 (+),score=336.65 GHRR01019372.1:1037-3904(+)